MVNAAADLVTTHGLDKLGVDADYFESDHNFLHDGRRKHKHDDDIMSMTGDADAEGMLKVSLQSNEKEYRVTKYFTLLCVMI